MGTNDPLASFRRQKPDANGHPQALSIEQATRGLKPYQAFEVRERGAERLEIRRVLGETHAPGYRYLMDVSFNGDQGTQIALIFSFLVVKIRGKRLQGLIRSLLEGTCLWIQDFHPNEFIATEASEAVIDSIELVVRGGEE